jgi:hypothetical protein
LANFSSHASFVLVVSLDFGPTSKSKCVFDVVSLFSKLRLETQDLPAIHHAEINKFGIWELLQYLDALEFTELYLLDTI